MPRKKIVFVIVEGPSDEEAIGVILTRIYKKDTVYLHVVRGDITTKAGVSPANIIAAVGDMARKYARNNNFKQSDFRQIIHQ